MRKAPKKNLKVRLRNLKRQRNGFHLPEADWPKRRLFGYVSGLFSLWLKPSWRIKWYLKWVKYLGNRKKNYALSYQEWHQFKKKNFYENESFIRNTNPYEHTNTRTNHLTLYYSIFVPLLPYNMVYICRKNGSPFWANLIPKWISGINVE